MNKFYEEVVVRILTDYEDIGKSILEYAKREAKQYVTTAVALRYLKSDSAMDEVTRKCFDDYYIESGYHLLNGRDDLVNLLMGFDKNEEIIAEYRNGVTKNRNLDLGSTILKHPRGFFRSKIDKTIIDEFYESVKTLQEIREQSLRFLIAAAEFKLQLIFGGESEMIKAIVKESYGYDTRIEINHQNISTYQRFFVMSMLFTMPNE